MGANNMLSPKNLSKKGEFLGFIKYEYTANVTTATE
jgi:hypothetical protein